MKKNNCYSIVPNNRTHSSLLNYCELPEIQNATFYPELEKHAYITKDGSERVCKGLISYIWSTYIPREYKLPTRSRRKGKSYKKKSGDNVVGIKVSDTIQEYILKGDTAISAATNQVKEYTTAIIEWLDSHGYELQSAELPVIFNKISRMTRADLITKDRSGKKLVVWEIKCGWPSCATSHKKYMKAPLDNVSCAAFNQWYIQSIYTHAGLKKKGLDSTSVKVLHCWREDINFSSKSKKKRSRDGNQLNLENNKPKIVYKVAARSMPDWAKIHESKIINEI